jgi:hypothetical protein
MSDLDDCTHHQEPGGATPQALHTALDSLVAQYLMANPQALPSTTSLMDLMQWSAARIITPEVVPP